MHQRLQPWMSVGEHSQQEEKTTQRCRMSVVVRRCDGVETSPGMSIQIPLMEVDLGDEALQHGGLTGMDPDARNND